jgi:hypothetical protein
VIADLITIFCLLFFQKDQLRELEKIMMDVSGKSYPGNSSVPDFLYGTSPGFLS